MLAQPRHEPTSTAGGTPNYSLINTSETELKWKYTTFQSVTILKSSSLLLRAPGAHSLHGFSPKLFCVHHQLVVVWTPGCLSKMESDKACNGELRRQMGSSSRIISLFPWWLEWSCTIIISELHILEDAFTAVTPEVSLFTRVDSTRLTKTFVSKVGHAHGSHLLRETTSRCSNHMGTNVIRIRRRCHASPKLNTRRSISSTACMDTRELPSAPGCSSDRQIPQQIFSYQEKPKRSNHLKQTASTAPWERSQFTHIQGENLHRILTCGGSSQLGADDLPTHAWRNVQSLEGLWATSSFLNVCTHILRGMHVHTQGACVCERAAGGGGW